MRKLQIRKVYQSFMNNILGANLAVMHSISIESKGLHFLLCVTDVICIGYSFER